VSVHGEGSIADRLHAAISEALRCDVPRVRSDEWTGLMVVEQQLRLTDGRPAWQVARETRYGNIAVFDELPIVSGGPIAYAAVGSEAWRESAAAWLQLLGFQPVEVADTPALIVARTLAMLVNEAADAVLQGVCTPQGADAAMKLGVNYPQGPFEWMEKLGAARVVGLIDALDESYRGERYRVSRLLRHLSASAPV
jgi:3-hydroxybutyryl-CoA dehydrogenase